MVGPWQTPVSDVGLTLWDFHGFGGQAIAMGERSPVAIMNPAAASRLALGEALTNLSAAHLGALDTVKLSANWMAACGEPGQDASLYDAVRALAKEICPALSLSIPVGKDSLSMRTVWEEGGKTKAVISPVSLNLTAVAAVLDVRQTWTPELRQDAGDTVLVLIDLGEGRSRLGASVLSEVIGQYGNRTADLDSPELLRKFYLAMQALHQTDLVLAYHDRSDGGLLATLCEMAFSARCGVTINIDLLTIDPAAADWGDFKIRPEQVAIQRDELSLRALFNEELGAVIQIPKNRRTELMNMLRSFDLARYSYEIGAINPRDNIEIYRDAKCIFQQPRKQLQREWSSVSQAIAELRDNPDCVREEFNDLECTIPAVVLTDSFLSAHRARAPSNLGIVQKPRVAVLREQGVNGHVEMAAAFDAAGFESWDVHMSDLISGRVRLSEFSGLVACGGFSYGDVLGAGQGWAKTILFHDELRAQFEEFFMDPGRFALGVCNGCQMLSGLSEIIPGSGSWPRFARNRSEQFEARLSFVEILESNSIFFKSMEGLKLPVVVSHGEGRAVAPSSGGHADAVTTGKAILRFIDRSGRPTECYPANPNGSAGGVTGFTNSDGRISLMMPHPERVFRQAQMSWVPPAFAGLGDETPWMQMFRNVRHWVKTQ